MEHCYLQTGPRSPKRSFHHLLSYLTRSGMVERVGARKKAGVPDIYNRLMPIMMYLVTTISATTATNPLLLTTCLVFKMVTILVTVMHQNTTGQAQEPSPGGIILLESNTCGPTPSQSGSCHLMQQCGSSKGLG